MGSVGDCYLGALCESFFPTLECELIEQETFADRSEARRSIFRFTEGFCNPDRLHSIIGALSPVDYEDEYHSHDHDELREGPTGGRWQEKKKTRPGKTEPERPTRGSRWQAGHPRTA